MAVRSQRQLGIKFIELLDILLATYLMKKRLINQILYNYLIHFFKFHFSIVFVLLSSWYYILKFDPHSIYFKYIILFTVNALMHVFFS